MQCRSWWLRRGALFALLAVHGALGCGDDHDATPARPRDAGGGKLDAGPAPPIHITPGQALAGACVLSANSTAFDVSRCRGLDKLEVCARQQCDLELCIDQCPQYVSCLQASDEPCPPDCVAELGCQVCVAEVTRCALTGTCVHTFTCAERVRGGYCDQLFRCCEKQGERSADCMTLAEASAALQGEQTCRTLLGTVSMLGDAGVPCEIEDAGTPKR